MLLLPLLAAGRFWGGSRARLAADGSRVGMICHRPFPFLLFFFFPVAAILESYQSAAALLFFSTLIRALLRGGSGAVPTGAAPR